MSGSLREALALADPDSAHWLLFHKPGAPQPPLNHLSVAETYRKFESEFLPRCPIIDPRGRQIRIRKSNFPKFLNLTVKLSFAPKKPSTIVDLIDRGSFDETEYDWARDRIQALFWVPDVLADPDAIYIKQASHGLIQAEEVYVKVYHKMGSPVKLVFVDYVGKNRDPVFITSFLTSPGTAMKQCKGKPLYRRP
jgi:hypothetical protein